MYKILIILGAFFVLAPISVHASEIRGIGVFDQVNEARVENHLKPLKPDLLLVKAAQIRANEMASKHYFSHKSPTGHNFVKVIRTLGGKEYLIGENLAELFTNTEDTVKAWMDSPTHRDNILEKGFTKTGIGIAHDGDNIIVVQLFGDR